MKNKIFVISSSRNEHILCIRETLKQMMVTGEFASLDGYDDTHSYWQKKLAFLQGKTFKWKYYLNEISIIRSRIEEYSPDIILIINPNIPWSTLRELSLNYRVVFWFVDSIVGWKDIVPLKNYDVFVYDHESQKYLRSKGVSSQYCPVGYNDFYKKKDNIVKDIDISFVGTPYKKRLRLLEKAAQIAVKKNWNMKVYGPFFSRGHFWKKIIFQQRYPNLSKYIVNGSQTPRKVAAIYARSKICLNIHDDKNKGVNPRTFEIMATGAMELLDVRSDYDILQPQKDMIVFSNVEEMVSKLEYYLSHDKEREQIAEAGYRCVKQFRSMENSLKEIFGGKQEGHD